MEKGTRKEADPDHGHERAAQSGHIFWFVCFGLRWVVVTVRGFSLLAGVGASHGSDLLQSPDSEVWASEVVAHRLWDLPGAGIEPVSPVLRGGLSIAPSRPYTGTCFTYVVLSNRYDNRDSHHHLPEEEETEAQVKSSAPGCAGGK